MSGLPPGADIARPTRHVRIVPQAEMTGAIHAKKAPRRRLFKSDLMIVHRSPSPVPYCWLTLSGVTPGLGFPPIKLFLYERMRPPLDVVRPVAFQAIVESLNDT